MNTSVDSVLDYAMIIQILKKQNITALNPIQIEAVKKGLFFHQNFLVCTPSGSGKTLIGVMAILNILLKNLGKAIYLVPYKALAHEKAGYFTNTLHPYNLKVSVTTGDTDAEIQDLAEADLVITTFEKCDALLRQNNPLFARVRVAIVDEIHEIGASQRGPRLENVVMKLLTKIKFLQFIALSATIGNYEQFHEWLETFGKKFILLHSYSRPVPLSYTLELYESKIPKIREIIIKTLEGNGQVLVFVNRRKDCVSFSQELKKTVNKYLDPAEIRKCETARKNLLRRKTLAKGLSDIIGYGIAYHNAALSSEDRHLIEDLYRQRVIKVLVATTTLAAGINTPARVVIVSDILQYRKMINLTEKNYKNPEMRLSYTEKGIMKVHSANILFQMLGRAGRFGLDTEGIGYILIRSEEEYEFVLGEYFKFENEILQPRYSELISKLGDTNALQEFILLLVAENPEISMAEIEKFLKRTFFAFCLQKSSVYEDLFQHFFIQRMNLGFFLQSYGSAFPNTVPVTCQISKVHSNRIEGSVFRNSGEYYCRINLAEGFFCSCNPAKKYKFDIKNDNKFYKKLCPHLTFFINALFSEDHPKDMKKHNAQKVIKSLIPLICNHQYVFDFLLREGLIKKVPHADRYLLSDFGSLAVSLYVYPEHLVNIKHLVESYAFSTDEFILENLLFFNSFKSSKHNLDTQLEILKLWISEHTFQHILEVFPKFGAGDIFGLTNEMARVASTFETITRFMQKKVVRNGKKVTFAKILSILSVRIKNGIKEELLDLMENLNVSRNQARILFNNGYESSESVFHSTPIEIHKKTGISLDRSGKMLSGKSESIRGSQKSLLEYT
ncbi:DEAD/DEAH box helicase [Promethearchaeum syntrophicum]|uniref:DEAD/DEAH box helicase n=1 Tax=Promethearchaeum syntrophicum TaxID=2594042 RepID=A0A5B9DC88_9ARCH|nr:DEAD/DEAH box helicase [Candidatus Prometheoarchaeum syntrophicum]QEE16306.1 Putative ski2-type helicase [Candidatus Prometheoarchaeum syntrophicum]